MFESLSEKLSGILDKLTGRGALSEEDVNAAMREVRRALLEADVALEVVRSFVDRTRTKAVGAAVIKSVKPGQMVVKIVHDSLVETLGGESQAIDLNAPAPVAIMLVGLQGAGKTTTAAKIAKRLTERDRRRVLMASLDVKRPAAQEQLAVLGRQVGVDTLPIIPGQDPVEIASRAESAARLQGYDVVLLDTAGRTHIDEPLMAEMVDIRDATQPHEILLVADALTGQDAVNLAKAFNEQVGLTGIVLTRMDGDGRGGAALSMRAVTGKPIKLLGVGEKMDAVEDFHPARLADRILGMGDIVSLVEKAAQTIDAEQAAKMAEKMRKGVFDLNDLSEQLEPNREARRHGRDHGHAARRRQDEGSARRGQSGRQDRQAPARDHLVDDPKGAAQPRHPQGLAQETHRRRLWRQRRAGQPVAQAAPADGRHDEDDGRRGGQAWRRDDGQARPDDGARQYADADARADRGPAETGRRRRSARISTRTPRHPERPAARRLQPSPAVPEAGRRRAQAPGLGRRLQPVRDKEKVIPVLETERLILREGRDSDFEIQAAFYADEEASKSVGGPLSRAEAWGRVAFNRGHWVLRGFGNWALEEKASGDYAGWCGLWYPEGFPECEVGWGLMRAKQGRGYATEAALRARSYAYDTLGWETAISLIAADNPRSIRVAERLGATLERLTEFEGKEFGVYRHPSARSLASASSAIH